MGDSMADTIESFVAKLKSEGVEEGKRQADHLREDAQRQADQVLADARSQAAKIIADANLEENKILGRGRTELELAARDATLKLREALEKLLEKILAEGVEEQLGDADFLKQLIELVVRQYLKADAAGSEVIVLGITPQMRHQLSDWVIDKLRVEARQDTTGLEIKDRLRQAGFEISFHGATIEITQDSIVETLMQLLGPSLREILGRVSEEA